MNIARRLAAAVFVFGSTLTTGALAAPPTQTMTIPNIGTSPVLAWSWGAANVVSIGSSSGGAGTGKAAFQDLSITRNSDGQTPLLFDALAQGTNLVTLTLVDGATTLTLSTVFLSSYSTGDGSPTGPQTPRTENLSFKFGAASYTVNGVSKCWSVVNNTPSCTVTLP